MVELDTIDGSKLGDDIQNICLLRGRELVFAMMDTIIWAVTPSEIGVNTLTSLSPITPRYIIIELCEAPCLTYQFLLTETAPLAILPSRGIHSLSSTTILRRQ